MGIGKAFAILIINVILIVITEIQIQRVVIAKCGKSQPIIKMWETTGTKRLNRF